MKKACVKPRYLGLGLSGGAAMCSGSGISVCQTALSGGTSAARRSCRVLRPLPSPLPLAIRHQFAHQLPAGDGFFGTSGGVIDALRRTGKAQLEGVAVFAEVVQQAGVAGDVGGAEGFGELGGKRGDVFGVAFQGLPVALRAVFGGVAVAGGHGALRLGLARYGSAA